MPRDVEILQDLLIFRVTREGCDLHVDLYGGSENVCAAVPFTFDTQEACDEHLATLLDWERAETAVTFVRHGSHITLVNDQVVLDQLAADAG